MAGHSKWANIKHRKAAQDAKRGKVFTKLIRELVIAARSGADPADNPRLRAAVDKALGANMKRDTIDNAIARGAGNSESDNMEEVTYEGYAVGGVAVLVETLTDNRNRTVADVRHAFSKHGGNLGTDGSVAYLFSKKGQISFDSGIDEDLLMEVALEAGAEDIESHPDGSLDVMTAWEDYLTVKDALLNAGLEPIASEVTMIAATTIPMDVETGRKVLALIEHIEDLDDVQEVYSNADFTAEVMEQILAE